MNADEGLQTMIVRHLRLERLTETDARRLTGTRSGRLSRTLVVRHSAV